MENNAPKQPTSSTTLSERIRNRLADDALAHDQGAIRIVTAMAQNCPELTHVDISELALGDDGLIRCAQWSASKCCAALLGTRRVTLLLPEGDDACEVRCRVIANASLATPRPLSGFLLKPVEILNGGAPRSAPASGTRAVRWNAFRMVQANPASRCSTPFPSTTTGNTRRLKGVTRPQRHFACFTGSVVGSLWAGRGSFVSHR